MMTDKEFAAMLREEAGAPGFMSMDQLERAAQRLEASSEITEAKVEAAADVIFGMVATGESAHAIARAALLAAREA